MPRTAPILKQACDACRRRKVKCDGQQPCGRCRSAGLACSSSLLRQKKGRQGHTANVLSELRATQASVEIPDNISSYTQLASAPLRTATVPGTDLTVQPSSDPATQGRFTRAPGLITPELIKACSDYFFARMGGTVPILHPVSFQKQIELAQGDCTHAYCMVTAFCAFVMIQTGYALSSVHKIPPAMSYGSHVEHGKVLMEEAMQARQHLDLFHHPIRRSIITAFLLYGCHIGLGNQRHAYYFLREATTLYTAGILDADTDANDEHPSVAGKLFWLLLVSERAHAIRRHRPVTLQITLDSPVLDPSKSNDSSATGFRCLVDLYRPFDETFLGLWNRTHSTCSVESLVKLEEHIQNAVPPDLDLPDVLMADLRVSQQWLRTMIWQVSTTLGFLSSKPAHKCMDFRYPLQIAQDLTYATWKLSQQSMETHGIGLIEKIFEVACTLIDVMACLAPAEVKSAGFELGPTDCLKHFFSLINGLHGGRQRFLPLLLTKAGQTLPAMVQPITHHLNLQPNPPLSISSTSPPMGNLYAGSSAGSLSARAAADEIMSSDWSYGNFNYAEMSRIGDKTPEIDEAFLQYSSLV